MKDRTVHAHYTGMEIVRYDRAGKWFLEPLDSRLPRQRVSVQQAVRSAVWGVENAGGEVFLRKFGGNTFDRLFLSATERAEASS